MTLALLLTAVTGAWAEEKSETISTTTSQKEYTGEHFKITTSKQNDGLGGLEVADLRNYAGGQVFFFIETLDGQNISKLDLQINDIEEASIDNLSLSSGTKSYDSNTKVLTITNVNDGFVQITLTEEDQYGIVRISSVTYYYEESPAGPEVAWNASTKTGTFAMPGSDVVLTPIYAKAAAFATTGTEPEVKTLLPEAAEGVIAGTDASLIAEGTGIVAFAGTSTEVKQGTLMYAIGTSATEAPALTAFSPTVPTAKDIADDGATVYVWYYIQGADTPDGETPTADNTFNDSEICTTPLTVTVRSNKFDLAFKAANANTIEAGKATVTVGGTAATVTDGKLQGVKMGSEVKVKANTGYKFRKVEVKKKAAAKPLANATTEDLGKVVGADGKIYATKADAEAVATGNSVAMICYVNEGHGLALALSDEGDMDWNTALTTCAAHTPAVTGATWKLASKSEMNLMINAAGNYAALRDGFSALGGTNMIDEYYWLSDESTADYAKNINFSYDDGWSQEFKDCAYKVRACLAF
jgi:hypothetical protein